MSSQVSIELKMGNIAVMTYPIWLTLTTKIPAPPGVDNADVYHHQDLAKNPGGDCDFGEISVWMPEN